jgi:RNA polymerase sporulation-specific sigma factor
LEGFDMAGNRVVICGVNTSKLPYLTEDEKNKLFDRMEQGDESARDEFIEGNLRLVLSVIQRFGSSNENPDDLFQVGCIGLIKALDNFDRSLNVKFSTYAVPMALRWCYTAYILHSF